MNLADKEDNLDQLLIKLVQEKNPTDVQQLVNLAKSESVFISKKDIMQRILYLQNQGKLKFRKPKLKPQTLPKLSAYIMTQEALWYWIIIFLTATTTITVFAIQEDSPPLTYIRNVLGVIFILFLPGYSLIKLLFPEKELNPIEQTALSIGMSLAIVSITGLILYYASWGITTVPITLSLLALTTIFATAAIAREHQYKINKKEDTETQ